MSCLANLRIEDIMRTLVCRYPFPAGVGDDSVSADGYVGMKRH
jgi:hypothetical protein